jgi:uncharacterized protein (DUF2235 family)
MGKQIVFCADGTWNGSGSDDEEPGPPTNVLKLFHNLAGVDSLDTIRLADEQERFLSDGAGGVLQAAKYLHGVGDSNNPLVKLLGGTLGAGLIARVIRGYTFVSRHYEVGDRIHLIGFSRGAYTARALAGLIASQGLLDPAQSDLQDRDNAYRLGAAAWSDYRRKALGGDPTLLGRLEDVLTSLPGFFSAGPASPPRRTGIGIATVAVWDTVGSLGIPQLNAKGAHLDALQFADTRLSKAVERGLHAVATDEQRQNFTPCLWSADARITQVLFPGAHADVGGGYPNTPQESGLSDATLAWMQAGVAAQGVRFTDPLATVPQPQAGASAHAPWQHLPWKAMGVAARVVPGQMPAGLLLHRSIIDRWREAAVVHDPGEAPRPYRPANLAKYLDLASGAALADIEVV